MTALGPILGSIVGVLLGHWIEKNRNSQQQLTRPGEQHLQGCIYAGQLLSLVQMEHGFE
jgi:membrane protein YqaA with SNARE-associated domain